MEKVESDLEKAYTDFTEMCSDFFGSYADSEVQHSRVPELQCQLDSTINKKFAVTVLSLSDRGAVRRSLVVLSLLLLRDMIRMELCLYSRIKLRSKNPSLVLLFPPS